jgi:hypothetical protein
LPAKAASLALQCVLPHTTCNSSVGLTSLSQHRYQKSTARRAQQEDRCGRVRQRCPDSCQKLLQSIVRQRCVESKPFPCSPHSRLACFLHILAWGASKPWKIMDLHEGHTISRARQRSSASKMLLTRVPAYGGERASLLQQRRRHVWSVLPHMPHRLRMA